DYSDSSSDDDLPLASSPSKPRAATYPKPEPDSDYADGPAAKPNGKVVTNGISTAPPKKKRVKKEDSNDDAIPKKTAVRKRKAKVESDASSGEEDAKPAAKKKVSRKRVKQENGESTPKVRKTAKKKGEKQTNGSQKEGKKTEEPEEEIFRWWDGMAQGDGSVKWRTLEHNGVIFPPPYEPLPSHVKLKYNGKDVNLPPESEEVAGFYAALVETDHGQDATFNKNFFNDFLEVLKKHPPVCGTKITSFAQCDFRPMFEYFEAEKAKKKALNAAEKKAAKAARDELEAPYKTCLLDGRKEKVGNFRIEPPGLFRGRGEHPRKGALKFRVRPEDITINIGENTPVPVPNMPGKWKAIQHDNTVTWLANWVENVNGSHKYVFLAAGSSLKGQSDMMKFEKARELKNHVDRIRLNYERDLKSKIMADRQRATAMYFIDKLALRAGNEKGEDEADTVGCCSLRCEHVTLEPPNFIVFDFLGKDSMRYYNRVAVEPQVFKNIRIFKSNKNDDDSLFDRVNTSLLNKHLNTEMKGLTAKVFRTFNASITFQRLLDEQRLEGASLQEKLNAYNKANRTVAILCNHRRTVAKTHDISIEKMRNKVRAMKYDRIRLCNELFVLEKKYQKQSQYTEDLSDIDDDWMDMYEDECEAKEIEKAQKKFAKQNEALVAEGESPEGTDILQRKIDDIKTEMKAQRKERRSGKYVPKRSRTPEKIIAMIEKIDERIRTTKLQITDKDDGKEIALGTSKINYLDPRITASWCKIYDVPIDKIFNKSLLVKFPWALEVDEDWKF
ncbi:hypothetical protein FISHEDRAFT_39784, partial [Fistulina hepatica ATCC 64428]